MSVYIVSALHVEILLVCKEQMHFNKMSMVTRCVFEFDFGQLNGVVTREMQTFYGITFILVSSIPIMPEEKNQASTPRFM